MVLNTILYGLFTGGVGCRAVVRFGSSLLGKLVDSLAPSITAILVRGKQVTIGVFGYDEEVIDNPLPPRDIKNILYNRCSGYDVTQAVLQQELIINIAKFLSTEPHLFSGILKIRIGSVRHLSQKKYTSLYSVQCIITSLRARYMNVHHSIHVTEYYVI